MAKEETTDVVVDNSVAQKTEVKMSAEAKHAQRYASIEQKRKGLVAIYRNEKKVPVTVSPFYAAYLGRVVRVSVNGIIVDIPADGQTYNINQTHAKHIIAKIKRIDAMISRQKKMSDVQHNVEFHPGELHL
jgi:hypothetical protein